MLYVRNVERPWMIDWLAPAILSSTSRHLSLSSRGDTGFIGRWGSSSSSSSSSKSRCHMGDVIICPTEMSQFIASPVRMFKKRYLVH